jgi:hypothetical protein
MTTTQQFSTHLHPEKDLLDEKHAPLGPPTPRRGSDESSTARSEYADVPALSEKAGTWTKVFEVFHTRSHLNLRIFSLDMEPLYYVTNSAFTPGTPDITMSAGSEKGGKIIGVCHWSHMYSKVVKVGLGDPNVMGGKDVIWEELVCTVGNVIQTEFKFSMIMPNSLERNTFVWNRSSKKELDDEDAEKWSYQNFRLIDESTGEVVAVFADNGFKSWKKKGKFKMWSGVYGEDWEKMVMLSCLSLIEKSRRRRRAQRSSNSGGN